MPVGAQYARVKNWVSTEDVTYSDLNAEFNNILTNFLPAMMDDYSVSATQMKLQTDPGEVGTESLATTLAGELERIRYALAEVKGTTYWYTSASSSITELASALGGGLAPNRISSGRERTDSSQGIFLVPHGAATTVTLKGATTPFVYYIAGTQYTISADVTITTLVTAPTSNNTCLVNDAGLTSQTFTKQLGEFDTEIPIDNVGSEVTTLNGKLAAFSVGSTEYFLARVDTTNNRLHKCFRGYFFDSADAPIPRLTLADNATITLMKLAWIYAKTNGTLTVSYTNPRIGDSSPASPATGDYWFDTVNEVWKYFDSAAWVSAGATLVGLAVINGTNCVAARSFDFFANYSDLNTVEIERLSATEVRSKAISSYLTVFGTTLNWKGDFLRWDITADRDSGVSESASTHYYCYVAENGNPVISDVAPYDRADLRGRYHPYHTWRCLGEFFNNASSDISGVVDYKAIIEKPLNCIITPSVGSSALTMGLYNEKGDPCTITAPVELLFRSSTLTSGLFVRRSLYYAPTLVISSTSTMGTLNGIAHWIYVYALDFSGTIELAASLTRFDEANVQSTTAEGGAGAADSATVLYSTTARTNVPVRFIARLSSTQATAGTWATAPAIVAPGERAALKFGTQISRTEETTYQATSDGFFIGCFAIAGADSTVARIEAFVDSVQANVDAETASYKRGAAFLYGQSGAYYATGESSSFCVPVASGHYYRGAYTLAQGTNNTARTYYWIPLE